MKKSDIARWAQAGQCYYPTNGITKYELENFKRGLNAGDFITVEEPCSEGDILWYGVNKSRYTMFEVSEKYAHVCVLHKQIGKRTVKIAMDYAKLYIVSGKRGKRFENDEQ